MSHGTQQMMSRTCNMPLHLSYKDRSEEFNKTSFATLVWLSKTSFITL